MTDLGVLPGRSESSAHAINGTGQIVGDSHTINSDGLPSMGHAFLWQKGRMTDLGILPGDEWSTAIALNDHGQIIGASGEHAVLWTLRSG